MSTGWVSKPASNPSTTLARTPLRRRDVTSDRAQRFAENNFAESSTPVRRQRRNPIARPIPNVVQPMPKPSTHTPVFIQESDDNDEDDDDDGEEEEEEEEEEDSVAQPMKR